MKRIKPYHSCHLFLPLYVEAVDDLGNNLGISRRELFLTEEETRDKVLAGSINSLLKTGFKSGTESSDIFTLLAHRLSYLTWLIEDLLDGDDARLRDDYKFRKRDDAKQKLPKIKQSSLIGSLILGFNERLDYYIKQLHETIESSEDGKNFNFKMEMPLQFNDLDYVKNLQQLADKNAAPAKLTLLLVERLNLFETVYARMKLAYKGISDPSGWPLEKIVLNTKGYATETFQDYEAMGHLNIFFELGDKVLICQGKVAERLVESSGKNKVDVMFDFLSSEYIQYITEYIEHRELTEAMKAFPE